MSFFMTVEDSIQRTIEELGETEASFHRWVCYLGGDFGEGNNYLEIINLFTEGIPKARVVDPGCRCIQQRWDGSKWESIPETRHDCGPISG